jgi:hypothetical protein
MIDTSNYLQISQHILQVAMLLAPTGVEQRNFGKLVDDLNWDVELSIEERLATTFEALAHVARGGSLQGVHPQMSKISYISVAPYLVGAVRKIAPSQRAAIDFSEFAAAINDSGRSDADKIDLLLSTLRNALVHNEWPNFGCFSRDMPTIELGDVPKPSPRSRP